METQGSSTIVMLAPVPSIKKRTRLEKIVKCLLAAGYQVDYYGWRRDKAAIPLAFDHPRVRETSILSNGGYGSRFTHFYYLFWMVKVFFYAMRHGDPNHPLYCLGFETALPGYLASIFTRARVIFDDADRFSMTAPLPKPVRAVIGFLEKWLSKRVSIQLVPGFSRYNWKTDRMVEIKNTPMRGDYEAALANPPQRPKGDLVVNVNGWLGKTRGLPIFIEAIKQLEQLDTRVVWVACGRVDSSVADEFIALDAVHYHGEVSQIEALRWYAVSDIVITYYDPSIEINRYAEANKWGDCFNCGTPFCVNSEVLTARPFVDSGAACSVPYFDSLALVKLLISLARDPKHLASCRASLEAGKEDFQPFEKAFAHVIERLKASHI